MIKATMAGKWRRIHFKITTLLRCKIRNAHSIFHVFQLLLAVTDVTKVLQLCSLNSHGGGVLLTILLIL